MNEQPDRTEDALLDLQHQLARVGISAERIEGENALMADLGGAAYKYTIEKQ
jgi:hypothetical protein